MKLTRLEKDKIEALKLAKHLLLNTRTHHTICNALPDNEAGDHLRNFIMAKIGCGYYHSWAIHKSGWSQEAACVAKQRHLDQENAGAVGADRVATRGRVRWIDAMITSIETRTDVQGDW